MAACETRLFRSILESETYSVLDVVPKPIFCIIVASNQRSCSFAKSQIWLVERGPELAMLSLHFGFQQTLLSSIRRSYARSMLGTWMRWSKPITTPRVRSLYIPGTRIGW